MALTREKKKEILHKLGDVVKQAKSIVFVHFKGLNMAGTTDMRRALSDNEVSYTVAKKSLMGKALTDAGVKGEMPETPGEVAWAYGEDLIAPARSIFEFKKKFPENLSILGGVFEGKFMNASEMSEIASIPALPVLHGKFVNIINSPIQRLVIGLKAIADSKN